MKKQNNKPTSKPAAAASFAAAAEPKERRRIGLPVLIIFFLAMWAWASLYYGPVFSMSREYSFWSTDSRQLAFLLSQSNGQLRCLGRMLLQVYKYPLLGGLLFAAVTTLGSWLLGYCLRLGSKLRALQFLPALAYVAVLTHKGLNIVFEAETGYILGIAFVAFVAIAICALAMRLALRKPMPSLLGGDCPRQHAFIQLAVIALAMFAIVGYNEQQRPYVRTISRMYMSLQEQDWRKVQQIARENAEQSNRPMSCFYAISLVQTGEIAERMYDIRLDYDSLDVYGMDGYHNNCTNMYVPEGSLYGGFVLTALHNCMEQMVMTGPTVRLLKMQVKCALLRYEWELAEKYLRILKDVPFEGDFIKKYEPMVKNAKLVEAEPEFARIRLTEPIHDSFESWYQQPTFMGYNISLVEGRSKEALVNSLCACLYTKLMPNFMERLQPLAGTTPPEIIADGILLASTKQPGIEKMFTGLDYRYSRLQSYMQTVQPYMSDRAKYAEELFPKNKGYYPYYYFFGNLKATKKGYTGTASSSSGVN